MIRCIGLIGIQAGFLALLVGCTSVRTTVLEQNECGQMVKDPHRPLKGVPVMLKVPTHIDVKIIQTEYWRLNEKKDGLLKIENAEGKRVVAEKIYTEKMFLLDPKRPAAGTGSFSLGFAQNSEKLPDVSGKGYLTSAQYSATDRTIEQSAELLSTAIGLFTPGLPAGLPTSRIEESNIVTTEKTIAFRRFPIRPGQTDCEIEAFVNQYVNQCTTPCRDPVARVAESPKTEVPFSGAESDEQ